MYIRTMYYSIGQAEMILMTVINSSLISYTDEIICTILSSYHRAPFFEGYKFREWEVRGNHFHKSTLVSSLQSAICVTIEFLLIFGETNFMQVPKIHKIHEICSPQKRRPTVCTIVT